MMSKQERIATCIGRHPDWNDVRVANSCGTLIGLVRAIRAGEPIPVETVSAPEPEPAGIVSLDKVLSKYDIKSAILRELAALPKGKLIEEGELCRRAAGNDRNRFRRTVENNADAFRDLRIKLKIDDSSEGKWFWGQAVDIAAALRMRDL